MTPSKLPQLIAPNSSLRKQVDEMSGEKVSACFQCEKCTNGCPVTFAMDIVPHKLMRCVNLGLRDEVLNSDTIWVCASCETCTTRCPNDIDIAHIMDTLRQISQREGIEASQKNVPLFHSAFLSSVKRHGRVHEMTMAIDFTLKSQGLKGLLGQAGMGLDMFKKGKLKLLPTQLGANSQVRNIFKKAKRKGR
ncbi:MAG: 4Fe-4S dicluster domain-containing protein [Chloroflexi bacterium]|nr:4Fe-4S dicluster domain-containing protein [Chloroflexota bacterium]